jgi:hypothetical protein
VIPSFISTSPREPLLLLVDIAEIDVGGRASAPPFLLRPPLQNARSLPNRYPDPRPMLDGVGKDFLRLAKIIAGIKQAIDFHAVPRPLFDLVEIAMVRNQRVVGLFIGPVAHRATYQV